MHVQSLAACHHTGYRYSMNLVIRLGEEGALLVNGLNLLANLPPSASQYDNVTVDGECDVE